MSELIKNEDIEHAFDEWEAGNYSTEDIAEYLNKIANERAFEELKEFSPFFDPDN